MRKIIKRLLKYYDYPPEHAKKALETVMRQAEKMCINQMDFVLLERAAEKEDEY